MIGGTLLLAAPAVALVTGFVGGVVATWLVRSLAWRLGFVAQPNPIVPQHTRPTACLGGTGVAIGAALGIGAAVTMFDPAAPDIDGGRSTLSRIAPNSIVVPALLFLVLGVLDDLIALRPSTKFLLQGLIAAVAVWLGVVGAITGIDTIDRLLTWLWIVALVNAFNFVDVCDGLLGGIGAVTFAFIAVAFAHTAPIAAATAGACVGFLVFNRPPASIYLGDAGSLLLGFLAAALILHGFDAAQGEERGSFAISVQALLLAAVPLFELVFLVIVRTRKASPPGAAAGSLRPATAGGGRIALAGGRVGLGLLRSLRRARACRAVPRRFGASGDRRGCDRSGARRRTDVDRSRADP